MTSFGFANASLMTSRYGKSTYFNEIELDILLDIFLLIENPPSITITFLPVHLSIDTFQVKNTREDWRQLN